MNSIRFNPSHVAAKGYLATTTTIQVFNFTRGNDFNIITMIVITTRDSWPYYWEQEAARGSWHHY